MTYDEASKMVEKEIKRNPGFAKIFKEHPERKEMYIHKILDSWDEVLGCTRPNPIWCQTCMFAHGKPPFEDLPDKGHCMIYSRSSGEMKPKEVLFDGEECEFYEEEVR